MPWTDFSQTTRLLALLGRARPEIHDVFPPHSHAGLDRFDAVALNPQPLPPRDPVLHSATVLAARLGALAVEADVRGEQPTRWVAEIIDDWCGTPWPRKWPWPGPGPHPADGPQPDPWVISAARAHGAVVLAGLAAGLADGELREVLAKGAEQLADVAVHGG